MLYLEDWRRFYKNVKISYQITPCYVTEWNNKEIDTYMGMQIGINREHENLNIILERKLFAEYLGDLSIDLKAKKTGQII